jgi:hypothetical protein
MSGAIPNPLIGTCTYRKLLDGIGQRLALAESMTRFIACSGSAPGSISPAGVVAWFYAVREV